MWENVFGVGGEAVEEYGNVSAECSSAAFCHDDDEFMCGGPSNEVWSRGVAAHEWYDKCFIPRIVEWYFLSLENDELVFACGVGGDEKCISAFFSDDVYHVFVASENFVRFSARPCGECADKVSFAVNE